MKWAPRGVRRMHVIYFSELVSSTHLPYAQDMWSIGSCSLAKDEMAAQQQRIVDHLVFSDDRHPQIAPYDIRRFVY